MHPQEAAQAEAMVAAGKPKKKKPGNKKRRKERNNKKRATGKFPIIREARHGFLFFASALGAHGARRASLYWEKRS